LKRPRGGLSKKLNRFFAHFKFLSFHPASLNAVTNFLIMDG
jgi:hypothetical protein